MKQYLFFLSVFLLTTLVFGAGCSGKKPTDTTGTDDSSSSSDTDTPSLDSATADTATADSETADSATADSETADSETADSETADSETADSETTDSETADSETVDSETADSETADSETADSETTDSETADSETVDSETADSETADSETTDSETADSETVDSETADSETADSETADSETADSETADSETTDSETADSETVDSETADSETADSETADSATADSDSDKLDDEYEPNDTADVAHPIQIGQIIEGILRVGSLLDYYSFIGTAGESVVISNLDELLENPADRVVIFLRDENDAVLTNETFTYAKPDKLVYILPYTGKYFIHVNVNSGPGAYQFKLGNGDAAGATLTLIEPNAGEQWEVATSKEITWTHTGAIENVILEYSLDNGNSFYRMVASTENDGSYIWEIPDTMSPSTEVKIRVSDAADALPYDVSDGVFELAPFGDDDYEPNENTGDAEIIFYDQEIAAALTLASGVDYYKFTGAANEVVTVTNTSSITNSEYPADRVMVKLLHSGAGEPVEAYFTALGTESIELELDEPGDYYVLVTRSPLNSGSTGVGNYAFTVTRETVTPPSLTLVAPAAEDRVEAGATVDIKWSSAGDVGNLLLEFSVDNGESYEIIADDVANTGVYSWTVPGNAQLSGAVVIRVSGAENGVVFGESEEAFNIVAPGDDEYEFNDNFDYAVEVAYGDDISAQITIGSQHDFYAFDGEKGDVVHLSWLAVSGANPADKVNEVVVFLKDKNRQLLTYQYFNVSEDDLLAYILPETGVYYIQVDISTGPVAYHFALSRGEATEQISWLNPADGDEWAIGSTQNISWSTTGGTVEEVSLMYSQDGIHYIDIISATPNAGTYAWTLPLKLELDKPLYLRVADVDDLVPYAALDGTLTLSKFPDDETDPNDNMDDADAIAYGDLVEAVVTQGSFSDFYKVYADAWDDVVISNESVGLENAAEKVTVFLFCGDSEKPASQVFEVGDSNSVMEQTSVEGWCFIHVRAASGAGKYRFRLTHVSHDAPTITLLSPNGGESWNVGNIIPVRWNNTGNIDSVNLAYSLNDGENYVSIADDIENTGSYDWKAPLFAENMDSILLRVENTDDASVMDVSDDGFDIVIPTDDETDSNDQIGLADFVAIGNSVLAVVTSSSWHDYYTFTGTVGDQIVITNTSTGLTSPADVVKVLLVNSAGNLLPGTAVTSFTSGGFETIQATAVADGPLYIHVFSSGISGEYRFKLEVR
ncbi:MAG: hypothetical protein JXR76_30055 [Deltaproteobacteria bacterium]|nr:hypothetical protein [Deltaproteobacteria bacterium]